MYGFGIVRWTRSELRHMDTTLRTTLSRNGLQHPRASVERLYISRKLGGRGFLNLERLHDQCLVSLAKYCSQSEEPIIKCLFRYHLSVMPPGRSIVMRAEKFLRSIDCWSDQGFGVGKTVIRTTCTRIRQMKISGMRLHGQFWSRVDGIADIGLSFLWLSSSTLQATTESTILAAQDQALRTRNYERAVMPTRSRADANCRLCHGSLESIQHLVSACPHLAPTQYVDRHNSIVRYLHWALSILHQVPDVHRSHYRHCLKPVVYGKDVRLFWEFTVPTVVPLRANRPDLILVDDRAKTALLIDVSVPLDSNINIKVSEKRLEYAPLCIELKNLWGVQATVLPIVVGALGCANGQVVEALDRLGCGQFSIVQELALRGTCSILRLVLGL